MDLTTIVGVTEVKVKWLSVEFLKKPFHHFYLGGGFGGPNFYGGRGGHRGKKEVNCKEFLKKIKLFSQGRGWRRRHGYGGGGGFGGPG